MSAIYPLHLQREIDRRWLQRSEETASVRARLKVIDFLRGAGVTHEDCDAATPPAGASSAKCSAARGTSLAQSSESGHPLGDHGIVLLLQGGGALGSYQGG